MFDPRGSRRTLVAVVANAARRLRRDLARDDAERLSKGVASASSRRGLRDGEGRSRRGRAREDDREGLAGRPATPMTPEARPQIHLRPCRTAPPGRSPLPSSGGRNQESDGSDRTMRARRSVDRRDAPLVETAYVARRRQRASNQNPGLRSAHCPNTEPRQDGGALHDSQRHGAALRTARSHGAALHSAALHMGSSAALRSRLPPSRPCGSERPCRWC
jgi:hypothetical protein